MEFLRMSSKQYREMLSHKTNKYGAIKTEIDGITFDSKKESKRYLELVAMQKVGTISKLRRQNAFILQEGFVNSQGQKIRPIIYIADFTYEKGGQKYVEDCKGGKATQTDVFKIKKKLFEKKYPEYYFILS